MLKALDEIIEINLPKGLQAVKPYVVKIVKEVIRNIRIEKDFLIPNEDVFSDRECITNEAIFNTIVFQESKIRHILKEEYENSWIYEEGVEDDSNA